MQSTNKTEKAIFDVVNGDVRFKRFSEFVKAAGLDEKLAKGQTLTVFAPTNEAFAALPREQVEDMLKPENREQLRKRMLSYMVPRSMDIDDLTKAGTLKTEAGTKVKVDVSKDQKQIKIVNANVVLPKEEAKNGILYRLDAVLEPTKTTAAAA
jgi:uncharacterized surface protein with fasciclin (FAS1) repeats